MEINQKKNSINVKEGKRSQVRWVRGEQPLLPLVSKETRSSFSALPVGYPGLHHCSLCPCTPLAEAPRQARACPGTRPGCCCDVALGSEAAWRPLAHWHASYPVDHDSIESKSFTVRRGQAAGPEAFLSQGFHPREMPAFFCLTNTKAGEIGSLAEKGSLILLRGKTFALMRVYRWLS